MKNTLTLTDEEMKIVRSALCNQSMKVLCHAQEVKREEKEKGLNNEGSQIYYDFHDEIKSIIAKIDRE
jgi:hypothetical protein